MSKQKTLGDTFISDYINEDPHQDKRIPDDDLIIFPTVLLSNQYKKELLEKNIPHNPDQITTLHDFCRRYHDEHGKKTRVISDGQARLILAITLDRIRHEIPLFFNKGSPSSRTIKDLYTLRSIISQRSIDFISHELTSNSEKCKQIAIALKSYEKTLEDNHFLDTSALIEWTISDISSKSEPVFTSVRMHRLFGIYLREKNLIVAIRNHAKKFRFEYLSGNDPDLFTPPDWLNSDEEIPIHPTPEFSCRSDIFTGTPEKNPDALLHIRVFGSATEELESIAEEIHFLVKNGIPLENIAVAFPNVKSILSSIQEILDDFGIPSYTDVGEPLLREPIIGFLLSFPSLVLDAYPRENVINLINSPYFNIKQPDLPQITVAEIDHVTRTAEIDGGFSWEEKLLFLKNSPEKLKSSLPRISEALIVSIDKWVAEIQADCNQFNDSLPPAGYIAIFERLCKRWMRPEYWTSRSDNTDQIFVREVRAYQKFLGCLTRVSSLLDQKDKIDLSHFLKFLTYLLEEPINLSTDSGGVRIMGILQTMGMQYSGLFLGGLVEGEIPNPSTRFPLLTSPESKQLGSRGLDDVIRSEQYYFISALAAGEQVWLSSSVIKGERKNLTSSFFERVKKVKSPPEWGREITHSRRRAAIRAGKTIGDQEGGINNPNDSITWLPAELTYGSVATRILVEDWYRTGTPDTVYDGILTEDTDVISWLSDSKMFGPDRIWSPTQLETYATCPFRFFLERVVTVNPLHEVDPTLSPAKKGTLIHDTLHDFFTRWCAEGPRQVTNQDVHEALELLMNIGTETCGSYWYLSPVWHATVASLLGFDGIPGLFERFLYHEASSKTFLRPERFEFKIGTCQDIHGDESGFVVLDSAEGEPVRICGRIDRIDTTADGHFAIIDYKTGSHYPNGKRIVEGKALQLPLYLLALEKMHEKDEQPLIGIGGSYLEISRRIKQSWPLLDPEMKQEAGVPRAMGTHDFRNVTKGSLIAAQRYITGIRCGVFPVTQENCLISTYCPYSSICRFNRFRMIEQTDEGGE